jgi:plastocyanin
VSVDPIRERDRGRGGGRNPYPNNNYDDEKSSGPKPYTFNGKVVLGIGLILAAAAGSTIAAMGVSTSPQIHLSQAGKMMAGTSAFGQKDQTLSQHIDKKFVLVQKDFGWNGTNGGPAIVVNKGDVVQITIINAGRMAHNFGIAKVSGKTMDILNQIGNMPLPDRANNVPYNVMAAMPCPDCHPFFQEGQIERFMQPDTQQVTTFTANEAGNFKYFCMVRGHLWLGMIGDLTVQDVKNPSSSSTTTSGGSGV